MVLASESVGGGGGGRSRETELPCIFICFLVLYKSGDGRWC